MSGQTSPTRQITAATLVAGLTGWSQGPGAKYERLAAAIAAAVEDETVPAGVRLPAERTLSAQLGVSRGTVVAAYDRLADAGLVERRQGSGTWVSADSAPGDPSFELEAAVRSRQLADRFFGGHDEVIDLAVSVVLDPGGVAGELVHLDDRSLGAVGAGHGYHPLGLPALRERVAAMYCAIGLPTDAEQIAVTVGGQQAISLTAEALVDPGDRVVLETATFPGAIDAYARAGARFETVAADSAGIQITALTRAMTGTPPPRVVYVIPTCHNPTGTIMPAHRRAEVAAVADNDETWVVEDESLSWLAFGSDGPPLPVTAYARSDRVITVGSLSKIVWGGLRLGWLRADPSVIARIARLRAVHDLGNDVVSQVVALRLLDDLPAIAADRRARLQRGAAVLADLLTEHLPDWSFRPPDGGLSLWVRLPGASGERFAATALRHGVAVLPGNASSPRDEHPDRIRISFAESEDRLAEGVRRLLEAWHADVPATPAATMRTTLG